MGSDCPKHRRGGGGGGGGAGGGRGGGGGGGGGGGWGGRGGGGGAPGQGLRVDLRLIYPQLSTDSHPLGENKINRNPL